MFDLDDFIASPSASALVDATKAQWTALASHYKLPITSSMRKSEIRESVVDHLVLNGVIAREDFGSVFPVKADTLTTEPVQDARADSLYQLEMAKVEVERIKAENERLRLSLSINGASQFKLSQAVKFVPHFNEEEPEWFFTHFERTAQLHGWPKDQWVLLVDTVLVGRAQEVFSAIDASHVNDYEYVKTAVLNVYKKVPEAYRQEFRNARKTDKQSWVEFIRQKQLLFRKWVESSLTTLDFKHLSELVILEDVKNSMPVKVRAHVDERQLQHLPDVGPAADHFVLTNPYVLSRPCELPSSKTTYGGAGGEADSPGTKAFCRYCKKKDHELSQCPKLANKRACEPVLSVGNSDVTPITTSKSSETVTPPSFLTPSDSLDMVHPLFRPFTFAGTIGSNSLSEHVRPVNILRDSGAIVSLVLREAVPSSDCYTGETVCIDGVCGSSVKGLPVCAVYLTCELVTGFVKLAVVNSIPTSGVSLLLGNDIAGDVIRQCPEISPEHTSDSNTKTLEPEHPSLFPACAITRNRSARNSTLENEASLPLNAPETNGSLSELSLKDFFNDSVGQGFQEKEGLLSNDKSPITREKLIEEQKQDGRLKRLFNSLVDDKELSEYPQCYYLKSGVLMRQHRPLHTPSSDTWETLHQVVLPHSLCNHVLAIAHDNTAGHLGVTKTFRKIFEHFYWPKMRNDVRKYCKTCHTCQVKGKPGPGVPPSPLIPIPVMDEPFSRIVIDCVGPLPRSKRGNQYLLTIIDAATRYPEAIPMKNITTRNVVKALVKFFTQVGLPVEVQTDQGSNFTSGLFEKVMKSLGITQYRSTAYHPQSQGVVERFHHTLKTMIRAYCLETGSEWDDAIDLLLFSIRDSVQESLGYSPFQLVYGHQVRGPLKVLKECWLDEENKIPAATYVESFKNKLRTAIAYAHANLSEAQCKMKKNYDEANKVKLREFKKGDLVLALLPLLQQPLKSRFSGPYQVLKRTSNVNYILATPERRKKKRVVHVNLLKEYHTREGVVVENAVPDNIKDVAMVVPCAADSGESEQLSMVDPMLTNSHVLGNIEQKLQHLSELQAASISSLLGEYAELFNDFPGTCPLLAHDILLSNHSPIRQAPYRLNTEKREFIDAELRRLKQLGMIRPSLSPWASPVVLVPKGEGYRLCIDYRKVNGVTVPDSYPLPRVDDIIDDLGRAKYLSKLDLLQGYYQVPLTTRAIPVSAFTTPSGLWEWTVLPFGLRNAPATFQRLMAFVTGDLEGVRCYLDDLVVWSETWEEHLTRLRSLFQALSSANLTVNLKKSEFAHAHVTFLGHVVGQGNVAPVEAKVEAILRYPAPGNRKELMRFIGMIGYYRRFCENFAQVSAPLTDLLSTKRTYKWSDECQLSFEKLKSVLASAPVLQAPNMNEPFTISVDASDRGVGAILLQPGSNRLLHPVCYYSFKFKPYQIPYATVEKEALGIMLALEKFRVYLSCTAHPITIQTDHNPLVFIDRVKFNNMRILRWALSLQPFNLKVVHIRGTDNLMADALSRM